MGDGKPICRYGIELEGAFKGQPTLVVPTAALHSVAAIEAMLVRHGFTNIAAEGYPTHIWLEVQLDEQWDWSKVIEITRLFNVTVQVTEGQSPPALFWDWTNRVCIVWMLRHDQYHMLRAAHYVKWATAPGHGFEARLTKLTFNEAAYDKDQLWPISS